MKPFFRPCPYCLPAIKAGLVFQNFLRQYEALEFRAHVIGPTNGSPPKINVNTFSVVCFKCKGTQEVLTTEGQRIFDLVNHLNSDDITPRFGVHVEEDQTLTDEQGVPL